MKIFKIWKGKLSKKFWYSDCSICKIKLTGLSWNEILWQSFIHHKEWHVGYWMVDGKITKWERRDYGWPINYIQPEVMDNFFRMIYGDRS